MDLKELKELKDLKDLNRFGRFLPERALHINPAIFHSFGVACGEKSYKSIQI